MTREELAQDLSYVRTLAEEGRHAPLIGGGYLVLFGVLLTITYLAHWALITGVLGAIPRAMLGVVWMGFGICAGFGSAYVRSRVKGKPGASSIINRIDRAVWASTMWAIGAVLVGTLLAMALRDDTSAPNAIMAAGFGFYGIALLTTASMSNQSWLSWFAWLAFAASTLLWLFRDEPWAYLLASASASLVLLVPGVLMLRREPAAIV